MKNTVKNVAYKVLGTSLLATALVGCGSANQNSETKVTNGITISDADYASVVLLYMEGDEGSGICTGTFINDSQVITAGHCVEGLDASAPALTVLGHTADGKLKRLTKALNFVRNPNYDISLGVNPYDVSIVNFPANSAPATSVRALKSPTRGAKLTIVGFGNNVNDFDSTGHQTGTGALTKRYGSNYVTSVSGGFINFDGLAAADGSTAAGTDVASGSGDSGGPLFVNGQLAGITSGGGLRSDGQGGYYATSKYVDLNSAYVKSFVTKYVKTK